MIKTDIAGRRFASFNRTQAGKMKLFLGFVSALVSIVATWAWNYHKNQEMVVRPDFEWAFYFYLAVFALIGMAKCLYDISIDIPYLHFSEDKFTFDEDPRIEGGYWRDVKEVIVPEPVPHQAATAGRVMILMQDGSKFDLDPTVINFAGADMAGIVRDFWEKALAKSGLTKPE